MDMSSAPTVARGKTDGTILAGRKADGYIVLLGLYIVPIVDSSAGWLALPVTTFEGARDILEGAEREELKSDTHLPSVKVSFKCACDLREVIDVCAASQ